ncbi:MAG: hypothetical protein AAF289_01545 [Cyanobacteria bacterium P01_A01_bin.135]
MELFYCFANASLTRRVSTYLKQRYRCCFNDVTVLFLNDCWVMRLMVRPTAPTAQRRNSLAILNENGVVYHPPLSLQAAFRELHCGKSTTAVMKQYQVAIVFHGEPNPVEITHFQEQFVNGLGYRPQSLV